MEWQKKKGHRYKTGMLLFKNDLVKRTVTTNKLKETAMKRTACSREGVDDAGPPSKKK
jgi:hypothetical protein